ncbi:MAG TPA: crotonyl-CoA carboxylase/reductase [Acidimicrobiales bacterium]|nr:crotonyl-CoA carboxylase/reductase [Acidimicrobiales bacterium]
MREIAEAILAGAGSEEIGALPIPESYRAAYVKRDEIAMFEGVESRDKDPRLSLHVGEVETPELAPDEVYLAVMASSINFNTVWSSIFEPIPTFAFLDRLGRESVWGARHVRDQHVVGSDASGVVVRVGSAVRNWKPGDQVTVHCNYVDDQDPFGHDDSMMSGNQRIWGFESNFGGLADLSIVKANQLMPKAAHLTWEEAAVNTLCASTSYRMLVGQNAARMKQGDIVLIWGATGGLGSYASQLVLNGGGIPVGVVSSPDKVELLHQLGVEYAIDRKAADYRFWSDEHTQDESEWRRFGRDIRDLTGADPDIVFEHPGRQTMGASVFVAARGGTIVTCAATSGYMIEYDNRHLWMKLKKLIASHFANYNEAWQMNRLLELGAIQPTLSETYELSEVGEAAYQVHRNLHEGKLGILCLAPEEGTGVTDPARREMIGEDRITLFHRHAQSVRAARAAQANSA